MKLLDKIGVRVIWDEANQEVQVELSATLPSGYTEHLNHKITEPMAKEVDEQKSKALVLAEPVTINNWADCE